MTQNSEIHNSLRFPIYQEFPKHLEISLYN